MIEPKHLLEYVIRPVLRSLDLWSEPAERLVLGTACQESECGRYLMQLGNVIGGGIGIYQMQADAHDDIYKNYLQYHRALMNRVIRWSVSSSPGVKPTAIGRTIEMAGNLYYATAMCRVLYYRVSDPIPDYLAGQAKYWKDHYNTIAGAGTTEQYMNNWNRFIVPGVV